jgi:hypothetical protein
MTTEREQALLEYINRIKVLLKRVEWEGLVGFDRAGCPICKVVSPSEDWLSESKEGHKPDCDLARELLP